MQDTDTHTAIVRITWTWLLVGLSQMTPLQVVQMLAGIVAIIYTSAQLYFLLRDRRAKREP